MNMEFKLKNSNFKVVYMENWCYFCDVDLILRRYGSADERRSTEFSG